MIKDYFFRATVDAYDFEQITHKFNEAVIIYVQYFRDEVIRDLDNRNRKHIQDAIRNTNIIDDDNWQKVWNIDVGFHDEKDNHVQVYVVSRKDYIDFLSYLMKHHEEMKEFKEDYITKEQHFLEYQERIKREKEDMKLNISDEYKPLIFR